MLNESESASGTAGDDSRGPGTDAVVRIPFVHGCRLTTASRVRGGLVCNLSIQGAYVTLDEPLPEAGESVHLTVSLPGQDPILTADAVVASQNRQAASGPDGLPPGVGLRFTAVPGADRRRIEGLLRQYHEGREGRNGFLLATPPHSGPRRVPFMRYGRLTGEGIGVTEALVCNLSRLGAYVAVRPTPEVGDAVGLTFSSPEGMTIDVKAVVTWRGAAGPGSTPGCGLRFVGLSKIDEVRIRALVDAFPRSRRA